MPVSAAVCGYLPRGGGWGVGASPSHLQTGCPQVHTARPGASQTPRPVPGPRGQLGLPAELGPSLSLPTRQEEDLFPQGEGLAVLVPCDLRARVSMDIAGEGDAAVDDGRDLLQVRACDAWWGCPRGHQGKERLLRLHPGGGTESYRVTQGFTSS